MGLQLNPGLSKYRVGLDDYKRMEGLMVGRRGTRKCLKVTGWPATGNCV